MFAVLASNCRCACHSAPFPLSLGQRCERAENSSNLSWVELQILDDAGKITYRNSWIRSHPISEKSILAPCAGGSLLVENRKRHNAGDLCLPAIMSEKEGSVAHQSLSYFWRQSADGEIDNSLCGDKLQRTMAVNAKGTQPLEQGCCGFNSRHLY